MGFWDLGRFIAQMEESGFSGQRHRLFLQSELAKPALFAAMVLIGAAFALRPTRFGQTGVMILLAVLAGFALYFLKDFAESLGGRGDIPLMVAAWTPPVAAILLAVEPPPAPRGRLMPRRHRALRSASPSHSPPRRLPAGAAAPRRHAVARPAQPLPASLVADQVTYDRESELLIATGNVEVLYQGRVLRATGSSTTRRRHEIRAEGPLLLTDPAGGVLIADSAALTPDLEDGLISSARLLIAGKLQLAAAEVRRTGRALRHALPHGRELLHHLRRQPDADLGDPRVAGDPGRGRRGGSTSRTRGSSSSASRSASCRGPASPSRA